MKISLTKQKKKKSVCFVINWKIYHNLFCNITRSPFRGTESRSAIVYVAFCYRQNCSLCYKGLICYGTSSTSHFCRAASPATNNNCCAIGFWYATSRFPILSFSQYYYLLVTSYHKCKVVKYKHSHVNFN